MGEAAAGAEGALARLRPGSHAGGLWVRPIYRELGYGEALPDVWVRHELVALLAQAAEDAANHGHGLLVWDGWRSLALQRTLFERYRAELAASTGLQGDALAEVVARFVTDPQRASAPPAHLTGGAVDLTLCDPATGAPREMGGAFDELSDRSRPGWYDDRVGAEERVYAERRAILRDAMESAGFTQLATEWWHFEHGTDLWAQDQAAEVRYGPAAGPES